MKVLLINTSERTGGAAVACGRIAKALRRGGIEVKTLVRDKQSADPDVVAVAPSTIGRLRNRWRFLWERLVIYVSNHFDRGLLFKVSIANTGTDISHHPLVQQADIIHLQWINQGFLSLRDIEKLTQLGKPIIWTMHDMWPFTGICHHACDCDKYTTRCGECPFLHSNKEDDLSTVIFHRKSFLNRSASHLVAVSSWLKNKAEASALTDHLHVSVIPNVIDTAVFSPMPKETARKRLGLPLDKKILIMGAARLDDTLKGFDMLREALKQLSRSEDYFLLLFGALKSDPREFLAGLPVANRWMGSLSDPKEIASLYCAADVTVVPSYYETFGQTIIEGMACGCPAVSFNNSGQTDIITHQQDGYLARYKDVADLSDGIEWVINNNGSGELSSAAIKKVLRCYTEEVVAKKYMEIYELLTRDVH